MLAPGLYRRIRRSHQDLAPSLGLPLYLCRDLPEQQVCLFERDIGISKERGRPGKDHQARRALANKGLEAAKGQASELVHGKGADDMDSGQDRLGIPPCGQRQARDDIGIGAVARINHKDPLSLEGVEPRGKGRQREDHARAPEECNNTCRRGLKQRPNQRRQPLVPECSTRHCIAGDTPAEPRLVTGTHGRDSYPGRLSVEPARA